MILFECARPFQCRPSYTSFGCFRRVMWLYFAVSHFDGGINELVCGLARTGARLDREQRGLDPWAEPVDFAPLRHPRSTS